MPQKNLIKIKVTGTILLPAGNPLYLVQCAAPLCRNYRAIVSGKPDDLTEACEIGADHLRDQHPQAFNHAIRREIQRRIFRDRWGW
jgi:hypothetical protein